VIVGWLIALLAAVVTLAGFTITYNSIPNYWKWANRIVPPTYAIYGLGASQLGDNHSPLVGPGLAADTTVSSYLKAVYDYDYDFR
jgi:ABC-type multidrug transport system permease subunit